MANDAVSSLLSYFGWAFLPGYITSFLQTLYYRVTIPAGHAHPRPGTPLFAQHRRRIHILVLTTYLLYTLYEILYQIALVGDFYTILNVSPDASEKLIKSRFRRLAAIYHPDKVANNGDAAGADGMLFLRLKIAQDTLVDPVKRFAYDRFGEEALRWGARESEKALSRYELVMAGLNAMVPSYVVNLIMLAGLNWFWLGGWGSYWRYTSLLALLTLEIYLTTHSIPAIPLRPPRNLSFLLPSAIVLPPHLLPFHIMTLARRLSISIHIFISQLSPPRTRQQQQQQTKIGPSPLAPLLERELATLQQHIKKADNEVSGLLRFAAAPVKGKPEATAQLKRGMKESLVLGAIRSTPEVQEAVAAVKRRKTEDTRRARDGLLGGGLRDEGPEAFASGRDPELSVPFDPQSLD